MWVNDANGGHYGRSIRWAQQYGMTSLYRQLWEKQAFGRAPIGAMFLEQPHVGVAKVVDLDPLGHQWDYLRGRQRLRGRIVVDELRDRI
ncbi:hypothetical protein T11_7680 [Trichinella zimbabwensis]|uniref:Uncharacterized protein n=1 Tax=Trichinella zimbabwensis TaxID=268475 RepID=A0A0V1GT18_9BILA|nr:hypothetical protein T11_7680 [Trichinella zimbabwensis]